MIKNYNDFIAALLEAGFSMAGGKDEGIFSLINFGWREEPPDSPLRWYGDDPETDPAQWREQMVPVMKGSGLRRVMTSRASK